MKYTKLSILLPALLIGGVGLPADASAQFQITIDDGRRGYGDAANLVERLSERLRDVHVTLHRAGLIQQYQPQMNYAREAIDELERMLEDDDAHPAQAIAQFRTFDSIWHDLAYQLQGRFGPGSQIGQQVAAVSQLDQQFHRTMNVGPSQGFGPGYRHETRRFDGYPHAAPRYGYGEPGFRQGPSHGYSRPRSGYGRGSYGYDREPSGYGRGSYGRGESPYGDGGLYGGRLSDSQPSMGGLAGRAADAAARLVDALAREVGPRSEIVYDARRFARAVDDLNRQVQRTRSARAAQEEADAVTWAWRRLEPQIRSLDPERAPYTVEVVAEIHNVLPPLYSTLGGRDPHPRHY